MPPTQQCNFSCGYFLLYYCFSHSWAREHALGPCMANLILDMVRLILFPLLIDYSKHACSGCLISVLYCLCSLPNLRLISQNFLKSLIVSVHNSSLVLTLNLKWYPRLCVQCENNLVSHDVIAF